MLRFSAQQKRFFDNAALDEFVARSAARIAIEFRVDAESMGREGVVLFVQHGVARARHHAIDDEHGIDLYLNLTLQLGAEFDMDPQLRWAAQVLAEKSLHLPPLAVRLEVAARAYLVAVAGRQYEHLRAAVLRLASARVDDLPTDEPGLVSWLAAIYPEKAIYLGNPGITDLVQRARAAAPAHGLGDVGGHALYAALMLLFGSGFERDPALPWAPGALADARRTPYPVRSAQLLERLREDLQRYVP